MGLTDECMARWMDRQMGGMNRMDGWLAGVDG